MMLVKSPFLKLDKPTALGHLKSSGSRDPDLLHAQKAHLIDVAKFPKLAGIYVMVMGALLTVTILGAFLGIPMLILGWWMRSRGVHNLKVVHQAYDEFVGAARAACLALAMLTAWALPADAQTDVVPPDLVGEWGPAGNCTGPLKLVLAEKQATLVNGKDEATHGNIAVTGSYFGHDYQGIMQVLLPDWDKTQPYVVTFNAGEKRGDVTVDFNDSALKQRFPFGTTVLRKCGPKTSSAAPAPEGSGKVCAGDPRCTEVTPFAATITDFRVSKAGSDKIVSYTVNFRNKTPRPLILGFVQPSGLVLDDEGVRFGLYGHSALRGIGPITGNTFDPKFVLQPGESGDARVELASRVSPGTIFGTVYDVEFAVREIEPLPGDQYQLGREHLLQIKGLTPAGSAAAVGAAGAPDGRPAVAVVPAAASASSPAPLPVEDACAGKPHCYGAGPFVAAVAQSTATKSGGYQTIRLNIRVRNVAAEPLVLGFKSGSQTASDDTGDRLRSNDGGVKGIGLVTRGGADPQFVLQPGQERAFTLDYYKGIYKGTVFGTRWNADFVLQQLEILPSRQVRTVRDYAISFQDLAAGGASGAASAGTAAQDVQTALEGLGKLFGKKKK